MDEGGRRLSSDTLSRQARWWLEVRIGGKNALDVTHAPENESSLSRGIEPFDIAFGFPRVPGLKPGAVKRSPVAA